MRTIKILAIFLYLFSIKVIEAQNVWQQKSDFSFAPKSSAVGFSIDNKGYLSTGSDTINGTAKDLWEYDPVTDTWTQKADLGGAVRANAVGFSIGNYGYVGTGNANSIQLDDFWQYDPVTNSWDKKKKFPGAKRELAIGFSIGDKGYLGTGSDNFSSTKGDFYEYDPATDEWTQRANVRKTEEAVGFSIGNKGYLAFGDPLDETLSSELWEYDPVIDDWIERAKCLGTPRASPVAFVIEGKAYVGTGGDTNGVALNDFWEYDPATDTWTEVSPLPAAPRYRAIAFAIGDKGYVGTGQEIGGDYFDDFWQFTAACETPVNPTTSNISASSAKLKWDAASGAVKYKVQYRADSAGAEWISKTINASKTALTINNLLPATTYKWKVRSICGDNQSGYSVAQTFSTLLRLEAQADRGNFVTIYPNPVSSGQSGSATIYFEVDANGHMNIELFDLAGRKLRTVYSSHSEAGEHSIELNGEGLSAGIYLIRAHLNDQQVITKVAVE